MGEVSEFLRKHFKHFNAATIIDAADAYHMHVHAGHPMMVTLAGAMSTAELGIILADMIRAGYVHAITCTGANLEEDIFNLIAHDHYKRIPNYRDLSPQDEEDLLTHGMNRVTDTCIPEAEAMRVIETHLLDLWRLTHMANSEYFPHEYIFKLLEHKIRRSEYQIPEEHSWVLAAKKAGIPIFVPGWEDSTLGNMFVAGVRRGEFTYDVMKSGPHYMGALIDWYIGMAESNPVRTPGFFQIGGGIAGDFPICVVPLINQDLVPRLVCDEVDPWGYFCQITDASESYGGYSGAPPNEKITWGKLYADTPRFTIQSDATIVAPLLFALVLDR